MGADTPNTRLTRKHHLLILAIAAIVEGLLFISCGYLQGRGSGHDVYPHLFHMPSVIIVFFVGVLLGVRNWSDGLFLSLVFIGQTAFYYGLLWFFTWVCFRTKKGIPRLRS
ncbi:MAG: hypothetical protein V1809_12445 [Planctomycetota bacterium]